MVASIPAAVCPAKATHTDTMTTFLRTMSMLVGCLAVGMSYILNAFNIFALSVKSTFALTQTERKYHLSLYYCYCYFCCYYYNHYNNNNNYYYYYYYYYDKHW